MLAIQIVLIRITFMRTNILETCKAQILETRIPISIFNVCIALVGFRTEMFVIKHCEREQQKTVLGGLNTKTLTKRL